MPAALTASAAIADWFTNNNGNTVSINPPGKTPLTGSGTATERVDTGNGSAYGIYMADWINTASGTFTFGANNYTALAVKHGGLVLPESAAPPAGGPGFRRPRSLKVLTLRH